MMKAEDDASQPRPDQDVPTRRRAREQQLFVNEKEKKTPHL